MRQYKDSGIEWIGKIPENWDICYLKCKALIERGGSPRPIEDYISDNGYNWIKIGDTIKGNKYITSVRQKIRKEGLNKTRLVHSGDLILTNSMSFGEPYILQVDGCIHDGWVAISNLNKIDKVFLYYLLLSPFCQYQFKLQVAGGVVQNLNVDKIAVTYILCPPLLEQQCIADYLDEKCGEIDSLIALQEQMIEKLKAYKQSVITEAVTKGLNPDAKIVPSGINWIKEIPEGWKVLPVKRMCQNITDGSHFSPNTAGEGKAYITVSNVYNDKVHVDEAAKISIDDFSVLVANGCQPPIGSVLLAKDGTVGRTAVVQDNDYVVLSSLGILTPLGTVLSKYLKYLLDSDPLQAQMQLAMAGSALRRITITKICKLIGIQPPLSEQKAIITHLNEKCAGIDRLIGLKQKKIEKLKDYKKSVIYEAVTGKTDLQDN